MSIYINIIDEMETFMTLIYYILFVYTIESYANTHSLIKI